MIKVNLRDYYPWHENDEIVEVSDEIAAELHADKIYEKIHKQRVKRNNAFYSLDAGDGIETSAIECHSDNPEAIFATMEQHCRLCQALNSLPEIQGLRVEAHFLLGKSRKEIADAEGVSESAVNQSIDRGIKAMRKYFSKSFENSLVKCPQSEAGI